MIPALVIIVLLTIVIIAYRRLDSTVFFIAIIDIFLRIISFIGSQIPDKEIQIILNRYFPASIPTIMSSFTDGIIYTLLIWAYVICYGIFLFYIIKSFFKRK